MSARSTDTADALRDAVRQKYAALAQGASQGEQGSCCSVASCCGAGAADPITSNLYSGEQVATVPAAAVQASLGCGNPTALLALHEGEAVLDLGSGGGIDVLLSARRVGPTGFAYGLDVTDEMLALAERNRAAAGAQNVRFLKGHIEAIPLPDQSVDVIISNCVINLSADKGQVLREAFRVLRPGGRFAVSDVVVQGELPVELRRNLEAWVGCVAGALEETEYRRLLAEAGFEAVEVEVTRVYDYQDLAQRVSGQPAPLPAVAPTPGRIVSAFVRARKAA
ncbi:MAG TPA: arsenite methyltransferase [Chloroflexota bacterium]|jgi:ubiquinone/menaquinone biosynthesis C-methylase UbiE